MFINIINHSNHQRVQCLPGLRSDNIIFEDYLAKIIKLKIRMEKYNVIIIYEFTKQNGKRNLLTVTQILPYNKCSEKIIKMANILQNMSCFLFE